MFRMVSPAYWQVAATTFRPFSFSARVLFSFKITKSNICFKNTFEYKTLDSGSTLKSYDSNSAVKSSMAETETLGQLSKTYWLNPA